MSKPPAVHVGPLEQSFTAKPGEEPQEGQIRLRTGSRKWVYGQVECAAPWVRVLTPLVSGAQDAVALERAVRAFNPVPGAWTTLPNGERLKVLAAEVERHRNPGHAAPGTVLDDALAIASGGPTALRPTLVQRPGKRPMAASEMLRGFVVKPGSQLA